MSIISLLHLYSRSHFFAVTEFSYDTRRISRDHHITGKWFRYNRGGSNDRIVADRNAGEYRDPAANPDVIADGDRLGDTDLLSPWFRV